MKKFSLVQAAAALALDFGLAAPAAAQMTYHFGDGGNCDFPSGNPCSVAGSGTVAGGLSLSGWAAASGASFEAFTLSNQGGSGIGLTHGGETTSSPQHGIDNDTQTAPVLLNFGSNRVVATGIGTGWSRNDTDVALLRWTGSTGPDLRSTKVDGVDGLVAKGWQIVASADLDGMAGGGALGAPDSARDCFKLLSVSAPCVGNASGGACNGVPSTARVAEAASLALAAVALAGLGISRRKRRG